MPSSISREDWGIVDGKHVFLFTISNSCGMTFKCTNYGATIVSVHAPDRHGHSEEVTLCYNNLPMLQMESGRPYYGCAVGRVANRIAKGTFTINEQQFSVAVNNGPNHLHGGLKGFDQQVWKAVEVNGPDRIGVEFQYSSPDGEEGYPGNLLVNGSPGF